MHNINRNSKFRTLIHLKYAKSNKGNSYWWLWLFISLWASMPLLAQSPKPYWIIRGGYLRSNATLKREPIQSPVYFGGIRPLNSYYIGTGYYRPLSDALALQLDVNYQRKGVTLVSLANQASLVNAYYYMGLMPSISIKPSDHLGIYVGAEFNTLLNERSVWPNAVPFEWSISGRMGYKFNRIEIGISLVRALTAHNETGVLPLSGTRFKFINYNWQAGLTLDLKGRTKKKSRGNSSDL